MPSLPTSLIIVCLVAAWLVVLVPMVSRRREEVPENLDDDGSARVLDRRSRLGRRRAVLSRTVMAHRSRGSDEVPGFGEPEPGVADSEPGVADSEPARVGSDVRLGVLDAVDEENPVGEDMSDAADGQDGGAATDVPPRRVRYDMTDRQGDRRPDVLSAQHEGGDAAAYRGAGVRPGRGGFNPAAADRARAYRFRQRRRVALALVLVSLAGAAAGFLGAGFGYPVAVGGGVLLVLYFAYLRRRVRIEAEISHRRMARLDRARQIRPAYRPSVAEQVYAHRTGELPRPGAADGYRVKSHARGGVPAPGHGYGVPVDLDDGDPVFDDLEYYRPAAFRRRAG